MLEVVAWRRDRSQTLSCERTHKVASASGILRWPVERSASLRILLLLSVSTGLAILEKGRSDLSTSGAET
jgi:hypothetical protein